MVPKKAVKVFHHAVSPEAIQRHEPNVDAAKMQGQASMERIVEVGVHRHVQLVQDLHGKEGPSHPSDGTVQRLAFKPVEPTNEQQPERQAPKQKHPVAKLRGMDDHVVCVEQCHAPGKPS